MLLVQHGPGKLLGPSTLIRRDDSSRSHASWQWSRFCGFSAALLAAYNALCLLCWLVSGEGRCGVLLMHCCAGGCRVRGLTCYPEVMVQRASAAVVHC